KSIDERSRTIGLSIVYDRRRKDSVAAIGGCASGCELARDAPSPNARRVSRRRGAGRSGNGSSCAADQAAATKEGIMSVRIITTCSTHGRIKATDRARCEAEGCQLTEATQRLQSKKGLIKGKRCSCSKD